MEDIRQIAASLEVDEQYRGVCPFCNGGSKRERSLSIVKGQDATIWRCWRASCGRKGVLAGSGGATSLVRTRHGQESQESRPAPYSGRLYAPDEGWEAYLKEVVGLTRADISRADLRITDSGRVAFPILGPIGKRRGWVLRSYSGAEPKALNHMETDEPPVSYYFRSTGARGDTVLVVEDIPSALRASTLMDACAACGIPGAAVVGEVAALYRHVVWALDADATASALDLHRQHALRFESSRVLVLPKDLKDMTDEEIDECLKPYIK